LHSYGNLIVVVNFTQFGDLSFGYVRNVTKIIVHPQLVNDIALLFLDSPVLEVTPVALNNNLINPEDNDVLTAIGTGQTIHLGNLSDQLLEVDLPKVNDDICAGLQLQSSIDTVLCAGFFNSSKGTCLYDEGR
jgi:Trypsin